ncbi:MAG: SUMF1/EgtB/PvdO family nonheme iron enzyme [Bacteroidota bacterium]
MLSSCENSKALIGENEVQITIQLKEGKKTLLVDKTEVTNAQFQEFISETKYKTTAERDFTLQIMKNDLIVDSLIHAGSLVFAKTEGPVRLNDYSQWWRWVEGASWKTPEGPDSDIKTKMDHPVVHVSYEDVNAYAEWAGKRLPTEQEWELLAAGGEENRFAWGNEKADQASTKANFWQGLFPFKNTIEDGFEGTAPVKSFAANAYGLYEMSGNVWEWAISENGQPVVKGGSFLCNDSYCSGYRIDSRMPNDRESSLNHTGFRLVKDLR